VVTPDLPTSDDGAGLGEYTQVVTDAVGDRSGLIVVGQSMGALTATLFAARTPVDLLALVVPMVPVPGETPGDWWAATRQDAAARAYAAAQGRPYSEDPVELFLHDVPDDVVAASAEHAREQSGAPFPLPWPLTEWPDVRTKVLVGRYDRLFPLEFQRRVVRQRLGIEPDVLDTGHCPALARPVELVERLEALRLTA
jgi:pimeloyl-ACP methyl ester carboxylesterase